MADDQAPLQERYEAALAELSAKQRIFVVEYLSCLNASEAARRAKYATKANVQGARMLANASIALAVDLGFQLQAMPANEVLARIADQARGSMDDFLDEAGDIDLRRARKHGKLHLVKARSLTKEGERIELYDAQAALALLAKQLGLLVEKIEHTGELVKVYAGIDPDKV